MDETLWSYCRLLQPRHENDPVGRGHSVRTVEAGGALCSQALGQAGDRTPDVHDRVVPLCLLTQPPLAIGPPGLGHVHVRRRQGYFQGTEIVHQRHLPV